MALNERVGNGRGFETVLRKVVKHCFRRRQWQENLEVLELIRRECKKAGIEAGELAAGRER